MENRQDFNSDHKNGLSYLLHSCGNIEQVMPDLINDVKIDGRYCLGSGNSTANYIPLKNYFAMVEEGLNYGC